MKDRNTIESTNTDENVKEILPTLVSSEMSSYVQAGWLLMTVRPQESDFDWLRRAVPWPLQRSHTHIYHDEDTTQIQGIYKYTQIYIQIQSKNTYRQCFDHLKVQESYQNGPEQDEYGRQELMIYVITYTSKQFSLQTYARIRFGYIGYICKIFVKSFFSSSSPPRLALKAGLIKKPPL